MTTGGTTTRATVDDEGNLSESLNLNPVDSNVMGRNLLTEITVKSLMYGAP